MSSALATDAGVRRARDGALLGGVCQGVARAVGIDVLLVRLAVLAGVIGTGVGGLLYLGAWVLLPREDDATAGPRPAGTSRRTNAKEAAGVGLLVLAALGALRELGVWWSDAVVWPVVFTSAGLALIWRQSRTSIGVDAATTAAPPAPGHVPTPAFGPLGELPRLSPRLVAGAGLVVLGGVFVLQSFSSLGELAAATAVLLAGVTLIFGTSWLGLAASLREERAARIRSQERAEVAAHLHDSVLQTLALIQRRGDPETAQLARRQERELRAWLDGHQDADRPTTLAAALRRAAAETEADHRVAVEVVAVGDAPLDPRLVALAAAAKEAMVNAAKWAGTDRIDVFAEATADRAEVFVRDRGTGFDRARVDPERRGLTHSIEDRMRRHGGSATIRSAVGQGTEVELEVAR